jgi:hypothetical protein
MVLVAPSAHALTALLSCWQQWSWFFADLVRLAHCCPQCCPVHPQGRGLETPMTGFCTHRYWLTGADLFAAPFFHHGVGPLRGSVPH